MTKSDKAERAAWITVMMETFGRKASEPLLTGYELALSDLPPEAVQLAVESWLRQSEDHPASPGKLREMCGVTSLSDRAVLAWDAVLKAVPIGSYKSVDFDDFLINATIRSMGGWVSLLARCGDDFDIWARKTFCETYEAYARSGVNGDACRALPGLSDTGPQDVLNIDGTMTTVYLPGPAVITTGLPALPGVDRQRIEQRADVPRVELKKP